MFTNREQAFVTWAASRQHAMLRTAMLLTGDQTRALDLVEHALARSALAWHRIRRDDPESYADQTMARRSTSWWHEHHRTPGPPAATPVRDVRPDDLDLDRALRVRSALARLGDRQRAVLVLQFHHDFSVARTADALGLGGGPVAELTMEALRQLRHQVPEFDTSDDGVHQLLADAVEDVPAPDLLETALAESRRLRRRRVAQVAVAGCALLVVGALGANGTGTGSDPDAAPTPPPREAVEWNGYRVWTAPALADELSLPMEPSPVPEMVHLNRPFAEGPLSSAVAAYGQYTVGASPRLSEVVLVDAAGGVHLVGVPDLDLDAGPGHDPLQPFGEQALSPDGTRLVVGEVGAIRVYDLAIGVWSRYPVEPGVAVDMPSWLTRSMVRVGPGRALPLDGQGTVAVTEPAAVLPDGFAPTGPLHRSTTWAAQAAHGQEVPVVDAGPDPDVIMAEQPGGAKGLLVVQDEEPSRDDEPNRLSPCCRVAGWLDDDTLVFESASTEGLRLLSWNVTNGAVGLVSALIPPTNKTVVGSYADLGSYPGSWGAGSGEEADWMLRIGDDETPSLTGRRSP